ncbi:MAG TPA: hypothetical protein VGF94_01575 [Kofleriaceae bacterium]|jgi:hypothetical protein
MKIRNLIGLGTIGGLLYLHRKRGGEWSLTSIQESIGQLWHGVMAAAEKAKAEAKRELRDVKTHVEAKTQEASQLGKNGRIS